MVFMSELQLVSIFFYDTFSSCRASLVAQLVKNLSAV